MRNNIDTVLFDLDGTLLPMDQDLFIRDYFGRLAAWLAPYGYDPQETVQAVWKGTAAMTANDGTMTNEERFWLVFDQVTGRDNRSSYDVFDTFYRQEFPKVQASTGFDADCAAIVHDLKEAGYTVVLATNPLFPRVATQERMRWAGLDPHDLVMVTTYEDCSFCKPNPLYFKEITDKLGIDPRKCAMIGNDAGEDLPAGSLGMDVFLLTRDLINSKNIDISTVAQGDTHDLRRWLGL